MANPPYYTDISITVYDGSYQEISPYELCPYSYYEAVVNYNNNYQCSVSDYDWNLPEGFTEIYSYGDAITFYTGSSGGGYATVEAITCCGYKEVVSEYFLAEGECGGYFMSFSPNPSKGETILELKTDESQKLIDALTSWDMEIYSMNQTLKTSARNLSESTRRINVSDWDEGVYLVRVKIKDKWISGKLVVSH